MTAGTSSGQLAENICGSPKLPVRNELFSTSADARHRGMMGTVVAAAEEEFNTHVPVLIVGAGAAGLCAALAAKEAGVDVVVVERDAVPLGSTALSGGLIPAAGPRVPRA